LGEEHGFFEGLIAGGFALGSQGAEFGRVSLDRALESLPVKSHQLEVLAFGEPGFGLRDAGALLARVGFWPGCAGCKEGMPV
jgi:hypothetical protein